MYHLSDYHFDLPDSLIARYPTEKRSQSRLLVVDKAAKQWEDKSFVDLANYLHPGDLLVLNNSKVMLARFYGHKKSGGRVECLIERVLDSTHALAHLRASKSPKSEQIIYLSGDDAIKVLGREGDLFVLESITGRSFYEIMQAFGEVPIPSYFKRPAENLDKERYQTVYARDDGSVAAPTAGLHFELSFLEALKAKGIDLAYLTLHVGAGTFQPVRVDNIREHALHAERIEVSKSVCEAILRTKASGGRVIAVGTTTVRSLETAARDGQLKAFAGESNLFIYPGYEFKVIDGLLTNFHLPESSLLMLVAAFAGYETMRAAYEHAIQAQYRFYSYGDCMLIV